jgi:hypothetical protein
MRVIEQAAVPLPAEGWRESAPLPGGKAMRECEQVRSSEDTVRS